MTTVDEGDGGTTADDVVDSAMGGEGGDVGVGSADDDTSGEGTAEGAATADVANASPSTGVTETASVSSSGRGLASSIDSSHGSDISS